jgi:hypothetical protein
MRDPRYAPTIPNLRYQSPLLLLLRQCHQIYGRASCRGCLQLVRVYRKSESTSLQDVNHALIVVDSLLNMRVNVLFTARFPAFRCTSDSSAGRPFWFGGMVDKRVLFAGIKLRDIIARIGKDWDACWRVFSSSEALKSEAIIPSSFSGSPRVGCNLFAQDGLILKECSGSCVHTGDVFLARCFDRSR